MGQPIAVQPETTVAFLGRALRGPLNDPVLVNNFGEFRRRFGDVWKHSSLGPAVRQFFDHGGRQLYVVRVANNARGPMICLPASGSALVLRGVEPGSTERIRAAIDYDRIDPEDDEHFNLTLQRTDPGTGLVTDQEMYSRLSYRDDAEDFVAERLAASTIARVAEPLPRQRPEPTAGSHLPHDAAYADPAEDGTDGEELTDYDLIGSRRRETGLFALQQVQRIDLLYLPPPGRGREPGPASLLAAEQYCRMRGAMLIADPAAAWDSPQKAVAGVRAAGLGSPNVFMYFPRMARRRGADTGPRAVGAALAGLLCKLDRTAGCWQDLDRQGLGLGRELAAACDVDDGNRALLLREGINVIAPGPAGRARVHGGVTLGRGRESHRRFTSLPVRRLFLQVVKSIEAGTRWVVFERDDAHLAARIGAQVTAYLSALADLGAFEDDRFVVDCDAGLAHRPGAAPRGVTIVVGFHPLGGRHPLSFTLHQTAAGCRVTSTAFGPVMENCA